MVSRMPLPRRAAMGAFIDGNFYVFGGCISGDGDHAILSNDLWKFNPVVSTWELISENDNSEEINPYKPTARRFPGVACAQKHMYVVGGCSYDHNMKKSKFLNDIWLFDPEGGCRLIEDNTFTDNYNFEGRLPVGRYTHSTDILGDKIYIFGGWSRSMRGERRRYWLNDLWGYDIKKKEWASIEKQDDLKDYSSRAKRPANRYGQKGFIYKGGFYIFGGHGNFKDHNDFWKYDIKSNEWLQLNPDSNRNDIPSGRYGFTLIEVDDRFYLYGGRSRQNPQDMFDDLWVYHPTDNEWELCVQNTSKEGGPGYIGKAACGALDKSIYLFFGETFDFDTKSIVQHNEVWKYVIKENIWYKVSGSDENTVVLKL